VWLFALCVFDLWRKPHPRVNVPPGTVCDYDMEQGLLYKLVSSLINKFGT
jgi:hypothetical protein